MVKTQVQIGMKVKMRKMSLSKPITVFRTILHPPLYGLTEERALEDAKGKANILWHECSTNYKWVWENANKDSITFHAHYDIASLECRVAVTAQFEPEDLTYYLMAFEVA
jgi:hypothetical protein